MTTFLTAYGVPQFLEIHSLCLCISLGKATGDSLQSDSCELRCAIMIFLSLYLSKARLIELGLISQANSWQLNGSELSLAMAPVWLVASVAVCEIEQQNFTYTHGQNC